MIAKNRPHRTRIGKRNQVTIPAEMLRDLEIGPGDEVEVILSAQGSIGITKPMDPFERLRELRAEIRRLHPDVPPAPESDEEFEEMIHEALREHAERAAEDDLGIMRESRELNG